MIGLGDDFFCPSVPPCFQQSPVRCLRRSISPGKLDFLGDEFPMSSSTVLCPQCFNMFRADLLFRCVCERCCRCVQFLGSCYHLGDGVSLMHGKDFFAIAAFACFQESQSGWLLCLLVTRQENLSLCIREYGIMKFHW